MSQAAVRPSGAGRNANTVPQSTSCPESTETQIHALDFELEKSMRYHQRRGQFFDRMQNVTIIAVAVLGWVAFSESAGSAIIGSIGIVFAVPGALGLVLLLSHRAQAHEILFKRYKELACDLRTEEQTQEHLDYWARQDHQIIATEPPVYWALNAVCANEAVVAWGQGNQYLRKISLVPRLLMNFVKFDRGKFLPRQ